MYRLLMLLPLLALPALAATWYVDGSAVRPPRNASDAGLALNGGVTVNGRFEELSVSPPNALLADPDYAQVYDFYNPSCSAQLYTGTGNWMNQELTILVYPYRDSPDGKVFAPCSQTTISDYSSTSFGFQLFMFCDGIFSGFYVQVSDGGMTYHTDVGFQTILTITDVSGWNAGPVPAGLFLPYAISTGALPWESAWRLYTKREAGGRSVYGEGYSLTYASDSSGYGWAATLHWPAAEDVTSYILHNTTTGYWIETQETALRDTGDYALWNVGEPAVSPVSPFREVDDFFVGSNACVAVRINGAGQFETGAAPGTSPLKVVSDTLNENLNADLLDGLHASGFLTGAYGGNGIAVTRSGSEIQIVALPDAGFSPARWQILSIPGLSFLTGANPPVRTLASTVNPAYGLGWLASPTNTEADFVLRVPYGNAELDPVTGSKNNWHFGIALRLTNPNYTAPYSNVTFTVYWAVHWLNASAWSSGSRTVTQGIAHVAPTVLDFGSVTNNGLGSYDSLLIRGWLRRVPSATNDAPGRVVVDSLDFQFPFDTFGAGNREGDKLKP